MLDSKIVDVWMASISDHPGGLLEKVEGLAKTGADLEIMNAWRSAHKPGHGLVLLSPLADESQIVAAKKLGFERSNLVYVRLSCANEPGKGYAIIQAISAQSINIASAMGAKIGHEFVMYLAFDTAADAEKARRVLGHLP